MAKKKRTPDSRGYVREQVTLDGVAYDLRAKTDKELDEKINKLKTDHARHMLVANRSTTIAEWTETWLRVYKKGHIADAYYKDLEAMYNNHILPVIGRYKVSEIKNVHLKDLINAHKGKSQAFLKHMRSALFGLFDAAAENEMVHMNPARRLKLPEGTYKGRRAITAEERKHIILAADANPTPGIWIKTMLYCGLRPAEASALTWADIDFEKNIISVNTALESGRGGKIKKPKTEAGIRNVPIPLVLRLELLNRKLVSQSDYVFTTPNGCMISRDNIQNMWDRFKRQIDISMGATVGKRGKIEKSVVADDLCLYCLRHTYATDLQSAGVAMNVAKYLLGHEDVSTTANIYTHTADDIIEQARDAQNKFYEVGTKVGTK